jgi:hypothetical protein
MIFGRLCDVDQNPADFGDMPPLEPIPGMLLNGGEYELSEYGSEDGEYFDGLVRASDDELQFELTDDETDEHPFDQPAAIFPWQPGWQPSASSAWEPPFSAEPTASASFPLPPSHAPLPSMPWSGAELQQHQDQQQQQQQQ